VLAWPGGRGRRFDAILWQSTQPPFYERWPSYFDQWSLASESFGWDRRRSGGTVITSNATSGEVELNWLRGERVVASPSVDLRGLVWCGFGAKPRVLQLLEAHEDPREPQIARGTLRCYDELDGSFEIAADAEGRCELDVPSDPSERPVRLRVFKLRGTAGYDVSPAGRAQFSAGDTRTDDPLVSVPTVADAPADEVLIDLIGSADSPIHVVVRPRRDGLHLAYQRRDHNRRLTVHHPLDPKRAVCSIDLSRLRLRGLRFPGVEQPALHDLPLYWMRYLAKASAHLANKLEEVEVVDDGPEQVVVRLRSATPCGRVDSRYELTFPYLEDRVELLVRAHLSGASAWDLPTFEYADLFPATGIAPAEWDFRRIAFVGADSTRVSDPRDPYPTLGQVLELPAGALNAMQQAHAAPDAGPWRFSAATALVFHGSARGTILAVAVNRDPRVEHVATLCEHWMDVHLDVAASGRRPLSSEAEGSEAEALGTLESTAIPNELDAEFRLQILDPKLSFEDVVASARLLIAAGAS
jgi:hypothetical protein